MSSKILIVDDSPSIRRVVRSFLESKTDWQICGEAGNGKAAVDLVRRLKPDVVVLDWAMPVMNGMDAAREIAAVAPATKMILFTIHDWEPLGKVAKSLGFSAVLSKNSAKALDNLLTALQEASAVPTRATIPD